jgi:hypothetical protein
LRRKAHGRYLVISRQSGPMPSGQASGVAGVWATRLQKREEAGGTAASFAEPTALGGEGKSQKARAKQHETGCGQRKETVGDKVVMAHVTPSLSEFIKTFGTSSLKQAIRGAHAPA